MGLEAFACTCDFDDSYSWTSLGTRSVKSARKRHRCYECDRHIEPGQNYEVATAVCDGQLETYKTCSRCLRVRDWVKVHIPCFCWSYGGMLDDARNTVEEAMMFAPEDTEDMDLELEALIAGYEPHQCDFTGTDRRHCLCIDCEERRSEDQ